jgi:Protein of unknown function (DUF2867)
MRLPGLAWLELRVLRHGGETVYGQRAIFHPRGLTGHLYWWSVTLFHTLIFGRMLRNVAAAAERGDRSAGPDAVGVAPPEPEQPRGRRAESGRRRQR